MFRLHQAQVQKSPELITFNISIRFGKVRLKSLKSCLYQNVRNKKENTLSINGVFLTCHCSKLITILLALCSMLNHWVCLQLFDIIRATQYGVYERVMELIEGGYDVNQMDKENVSLMHWAAINNRIEIVKYVKPYFIHYLFIDTLHSDVFDIIYLLILCTQTHLTLFIY